MTTKIVDGFGNADLGVSALREKLLLDLIETDELYDGETHKRILGHADGSEGTARAGWLALLAAGEWGTGDLLSARQHARNAERDGSRLGGLIKLGVLQGLPFGIFVKLILGTAEQIDKDYDEHVTEHGKEI